MSTIAKKLMSTAGAGGDLDNYWIGAIVDSFSIDIKGTAVDSLGNIIAVGTTGNDTAGNVDCAIFKYDPSGILLWQKLLGGSSSDQAHAVAVDSDNNIIVVGLTESDGAGNNDCLIAKYNPSGVLQWARTLGRSTNEVAWAVAINSNNYIIITGFMQNPTGLLLAQYTPSGALVTDRVIEDGTGAMEGRGIAIDSSDNIVLVGITIAPTPPDTRALILKYSSSLVIQWQRSLQGTNSETVEGRGIAIDSSDNIIMVGRKKTFGAFIAKYNSSGTLQWQRDLNDIYSIRINAVAVDSADNIIVAGYTYSGNIVFLIAKYSPSGTLQWQRALGNSNYSEASGVAIDSSDNIIVVGNQGQPFMFAKLPPDGSGTGSYNLSNLASGGPIVYEEASATNLTLPYIDVATTFVDSNPSIFNFTAVLTDAAGSHNNTELVEITP